MTEPIRLMSTSYTVTLGSKRKPKCNGTTPAPAKNYAVGDSFRQGNQVLRIVRSDPPDQVWAVVEGE